jgi:hypothetical protein
VSPLRRPSSENALCVGRGSGGCGPNSPCRLLAGRGRASRCRGNCNSGVYFAVYMATRTQVYLTDEQRARLRERALATGVPMSQLIRDAVDSLLSQEDDLAATFGSSPRIGKRIPQRSEWDRRG